MLAQRRPIRRRGAVLVESAFVLAIFLMLLFGIFEYCRYLFVMHVSANAARDAARYAVVNTDKPSNFDTVDYTDSSGTKMSIRNYTNFRMAGVEKNIDGYTVAVFPCNPSQLNQTPPVVTPKTGAGVQWNSAAFTEKIAVRITGTYRPVLPSFLRMPTTIPFSVVSICGSEG